MNGFKENSAESFCEEITMATVESKKELQYLIHRACAQATTFIEKGMRFRDPEAFIEGYIAFDQIRQAVEARGEEVGPQLYDDVKAVVEDAADDAMHPKPPVDSIHRFSIDTLQSALNAFRGKSTDLSIETYEQITLVVGACRHLSDVSHGNYLALGEAIIESCKKTQSEMHVNVKSLLDAIDPDRPIVTELKTNIQKQLPATSARTRSVDDLML